MTVLIFGIYVFFPKKQLHEVLSYCCHLKVVKEELSCKKEGAWMWEKKTQKPQLLDSTTVKSGVFTMNMTAV